MEDVGQLLECPLKTLEEYVKELDEPTREIEKMIFLALQAHDMNEIAKMPQKEIAWLCARFCRMTSSRGGMTVCHSAYESPRSGLGAMLAHPVLDEYFHWVHKNEKEEDAKKSNDFKGPLEWGNAKEIFACYCYLKEQRRLVTLTYRQQRQKFIKNPEDFKTFEFRGQTLPVLDPHADPLVTSQHFGSVGKEGLKNHAFRIGSPDGILFINHQPFCLIEIKCSYKQQKALHPAFRCYNFDQLQFMLDIFRYYAPHLVLIDYINWSPLCWTWDTFYFDEHYWRHWYTPRELRFYFQFFLPLAAQKIFDVHEALLPDDTKQKKLSKPELFKTLSTTIAKYFSLDGNNPFKRAKAT